MGPEILRDLTFDLPKGSFQFLTGPSGAGKTTLLRLLFMSLQPTRGLIRSFGRDIIGIGTGFIGIEQGFLFLLDDREGFGFFGKSAQIGSTTRHGNLLTPCSALVVGNMSFS